jgi:hypothetical protein
MRQTLDRGIANGIVSEIALYVNHEGLGKEGG